VRFNWCFNMASTVGWRVQSHSTWASLNARPKTAVGRTLSLTEGLAALMMVIATVWMAAVQPVEPSDEAANPNQAALQDPALAQGREFVVSAYMGAPYTYPSDVTVKTPGRHDFTAKDVEWIGEPFDNPIYYGARVIGWGSGATGAMLDFTHSKAVAERTQILDIEGLLNGKPAEPGQKIKQVFQKLEASHGHNMLTLNGLLRLPSLFAARARPYVGVGAGVSLPHSEVHFAGDKKRTYEYQYAGPAGQALVGLEFRVNRMSYFIEYKFTVAPYRIPLTEDNGYLLFTDLWRQAKRWWNGEEPAAGWLTTTFASHQVIGGLGVRVTPMPPPVLTP
jgi:lipid A oxidase